MKEKDGNETYKQLCHEGIQHCSKIGACWHVKHGKTVGIQAYRKLLHMLCKPDVLVHQMKENQGKWNLWKDGAKYVKEGRFVVLFVATVAL